MKFLYLLCLSLAFLNPALAAKKDKVNPLILAAFLVKNGEIDRADEYIATISQETLKPEQKPEFFALAGLIKLRKQQFAAAEGFFAKVLQLQPKNAVARLNLAQSIAAQGRYGEVVPQLEKLGTVIDQYQDAFVLAVDALRKMNKQKDAWDYVERGQKRYPDALALKKRKAELCIDLGLYAVFQDETTTLIQALSVDEILYFAESLEQRKQTRVAGAFLERARLLHPLDERVQKVAALRHLDNGSPQTALRYYETLAHGNPTFYAEAAEVARKIGEAQRALYLNGSVADPQKKLRQRLGILLDLGEYDSVVALASRISRAGLLDDDSIRYALAYAHYQRKDFSRAEGYLGGIRDPQIFQNATTLRKAMADCKSQGWQCVL